MEPYDVGTLVTMTLGMTAGWFAGRRVGLPVKPVIWVLLAVAVLVTSFVGVNTKLAMLFGVGMMLNTALASFCFGIVISLWVRSRRLGVGVSKP